MKLALLMLAGTTALIEALKPCCYSKRMMGKTFTLIESNSKEVAAYGCNTANDCVYKDEGTSDRYCFKMGGQEEPECVQELPTCTKYFAQAHLTSPDVALQEIKTFAYSTADSGTCEVPKLPKPAFKGVTKGTLFTLAGDLLLFDLAGSYQRESLKLEGNSWVPNSFSVSSFPDEDYVIAAGATELYLIGGKRMRDNYNAVFKSVDGFNWIKQSWNIGKGRSNDNTFSFYSCITKNNESGNENLVLMGGLADGAGKGDQGDRGIQVFDLADTAPSGGRLVIDIPDAGFQVYGAMNQLVCHNGWMYATDKDSNLHMMKLKKNAAKDDILKFSYANIAKGGQLVVYDNQIGLVGGKKDTGGKGPEETQKNFVYYKDGAWREGAEFPATPFVKPSDYPLVPVVTK